MKGPHRRQHQHFFSMGLPVFRTRIERADTWQFMRTTAPRRPQTLGAGHPRESDRPHFGWYGEARKRTGRRCRFRSPRQVRGGSWLQYRGFRPVVDWRPLDALTTRPSPPPTSMRQMFDGLAPKRTIFQRPEKCSCTSMRKCRTPLSLSESESSFSVGRLAELSTGCLTGSVSLTTRCGTSSKGLDRAEGPEGRLESMCRSTRCSPRAGTTDVNLPASRARVTSSSRTGTTAAVA